MLSYYCGTGWAESKRAKLNMGADAYLCCPGPSLKLINPDTIKGRGRMVFGINTSYPYIKPDIWLGMDTIECYDRNILYEPFMKVFRAPFYNTMEFQGKPVKEFPNVYWASVDKPKEGETMFDRRAHSAHMVWHKSTLMVSIHMMIWMGAKNIFLAGCDMGGKEDYYKGNILTDDQRKYNKRLYDSQVAHLAQIVQLGKQHGINFYSITPDSPINDFMEYIEPEEAIRRSEEKTIINGDWDVKHVLDSRKLTVSTLLKKSDKYDEEYVYRIKKEVEKYLPNAKFVCLSDTELKGIETIPIEHPEFGNPKSPGWCKIELYKHFTKGKTLYIDISSIIKEDIKELANLDGYRMVRDFANTDYYSSCVMSWEGDHSYIYEKYLENPKKWEEEYSVKPSKVWKSGNSQLFVQHNAKNLKAFPVDWISSYKLSSKEHIDKSKIVKYHGRPNPREVGWSIYRPELQNNIVHVVNWAIWGGIQSMILSMSKEYTEYKHKVLVLNSKGVEQKCVDHFTKNNIEVEILKDVITEADVKKHCPNVVFFHNISKNKIENPDNWFKNYKTIAVNHGRLAADLPVDLYWFVSEWVAEAVKNKPKNYIILPPSCYTQDYLDITRPSDRSPVVGRIQSVTNINKGKYPEKFFELMEKIGGNQFIVGPKDGDAPVKPGMMQDYLKEIDIMVIWGDTVEASPLVITEANLSGIPVVQRNLNDGAAEKMTKSQGGILVDTEEEFIEAVEKLREDKSLREKLAKQGKEWNLQNSSTKLLRGYLRRYL